MKNKFELHSSDLMAANEASQRWGYHEGYVRQLWVKYPERFLTNSIRKFGKTYVITKEGMEYLTGVKEDGTSTKAQ